MLWFSKSLSMLFLIQAGTYWLSCAQFSYLILKMLFFLYSSLFWRWSQSSSNHFPVSSSLPLISELLSFNSLVALLSSFFVRFVLPRMPEDLFSLHLVLSINRRGLQKRKQNQSRTKLRLWFHGSMLCNWSFWLYIEKTGSKINCPPWSGSTRKTRYQRLFEVKGCLLENNGKLNLTPPTNTHCIY